MHVWLRVVQLNQGGATPRSITPMCNAIFASDRRYISRETILFISEHLGATGISTHKRSLDYTFVFGDGLMRKRQKGMVISERRCRAVYSATRNLSSSQGKPVKEVVYLESCSGRIAAVYHDNARLLGAHSFTLTPKAGSQNCNTSQNIGNLHEAYRAASTENVAGRIFIPTRSYSGDRFLPFFESFPGISGSYLLHINTGGNPRLVFNKSFPVHVKDNAHTHIVYCF